MGISSSKDARVDGLLSGYRWTASMLTWSAPDNAADYGSYRVDMDGDGRSAQADGFGRLTSAQRSAVSRVLEAGGAAAGFGVEGFTNLKVSYVGGGSGEADVRLAKTADAPTAYAFMPGAGYGGDVWLGKSASAPVTGNYANLTIMHELGHALGLSHAHEGGQFGKVPTEYDSLEFTVMTYRAHIGAPTKGYTFETWGAPQSYMMLDIAALQHLYGADFTVNAGNTLYKWTPESGRTLVDGKIAIDPGGNRIFATVWDGGGRDCYDLSAYSSAVSVDLGPGKHSRFSTAQLADLGGGPNGGHARGNIFNALQFRGDDRSLIEDANGGSGGDRIVGNAAANRLFGGSGADTLLGLGGADRLLGGRGADVFEFRSGYSTPASCDRIEAGGGAAAFEGAGSSGGDVIDLRRIDADAARSGDQAFAFGKVGKPGGLWVLDVGDVTHVRGNLDADMTIEFELRIVDGSLRAAAYEAFDFML